MGIFRLLILLILFAPHIAYAELPPIDPPQEALYGTWTLKKEGFTITRESFQKNGVYIQEQTYGQKPTPVSRTLGRYFWVTPKLIVIVFPDPVRAELWYVSIFRDQMILVDTRDVYFKIYYKDPRYNNELLPTKSTPSPSRPQRTDGNDWVRMALIRERPQNRRRDLLQSLGGTVFS